MFGKFNFPSFTWLQNSNYNIGEGEGAGEVAFFSAKRWHRRNRRRPNRIPNPLSRHSNSGVLPGIEPLRVTILGAKSEDHPTAPQHLQIMFMCARPVLEHFIRNILTLLHFAILVIVQAINKNYFCIFNRAKDESYN